MEGRRQWTGIFNVSNEHNGHHKSNSAPSENPTKPLRSCHQQVLTAGSLRMCFRQKDDGPGKKGLRCKKVGGTKEVENVVQ